MPTCRYCAYNQASECFLSLGVTVGKGPFAGWRRPSQRRDEGRWIIGRKHAFIGFLSRCDLVYLDSAHRVLHVAEAFLGLGFVPHHPGAESVLVLPVRTILSSQTQPGNQLVICEAKQMESRLRGESDAEPPLMPGASFVDWLERYAEPEHRKAARQRWPRMVACDAEGTQSKVHGIRDISATGLYLITPERWPVGSEVKLRFQHTDPAQSCLNDPATVTLTVCRWGEDGVGMEFAKSNIEQPALIAMQVH